MIIPALDEEASIGRVLGDLPAGLVDECIVVDNGSRDRTAAVARAYGASVVREAERGYGAACLAGLEALDPDCEVVVFLDADYSDHPEELSRILGPILDGTADFVLGTRTLERRARAALTPLQRWGNWLTTTLVWWRFGHRYTDLGPFRAIRRDALLALRMRDRTFGWTIEMQIRAVRRGLRVVEVPVRYRPRIGVSKISGTLSGSVRAGTKILYTVLKHAVR